MAACITALGIAACHAESTRRPGGGRTTAQPAARVEDLVAGFAFACARLSSGQVRCWGDNGQAQLGDGTRRRADTPQPVRGLDDATAIAVSGATVCALRGRGELVCWGRKVGAPEEFARGPEAIPDAPLARGLAMSDDQVHVLTRDGEVWSIAVKQQGKPVRSTDGAAQVVAHGDGVCVRTTAGRVRCWSDRAVPCTPTDDACGTPPGKDLGLRDVVDVAFGSNAVCALDKDGTVRCTTAPNLCYGAPQETGPRLIPGVHGGKRLFGTMCAEVDGRPWCWGDAAVRALGEDPCRATASLLLGFADFDAVTGENHGCVAAGDRLACWGMYGPWAQGESMVGLRNWSQIEGLHAPPRSATSPLDRWRDAHPEPKVAGFAYVWDNAPWFSTAAKTPFGTVDVFDDDQRFEGASSYTPVRIVRDGGAWVVVDTAVDPGDHCSSRSRLSSAHRVRGVVRKRDLVPVLVAPYARGFADGTGVTFGVGLPVRPTDDGFAIDAAMPLPFAPRPEDLGLSYPAATAIPSADGPAVWLEPDVPLRVDGKPMPWRGSSSEPVHLAGSDPHGDPYIDLAERCVSVRTLAPRERVGPPNSGGGGGLGTIGRGGGGSAGGFGEPAKRPRLWTVARGTKLLWPDGKDAGEMSATWSYRKPPEIKGTLACFEVRALVLCHDATDVTEQ